MPNLPVTVPEQFRIIAHRGASAYAPENTQPAFELARKMRVSEVEVDTQLATDGVIVLCHDDSLERYGHGDRVVERLSSSELLSTDVGSWFSPFFYADTPMITLKSLLQGFANDFVFHIELKGKSPHLSEGVFALLDGCNLVQDSIVTSFSWEQLARMRQISASCRLGWLVHEFNPQTFDRAAELSLFQLCPPAREVTEQLVELGHGVVKEVRVWGMNGTPPEVRSLIRRVVDCGCDGMTINWPDWATH